MHAVELSSLLMGWTSWPSQVKSGRSARFGLQYDLFSSIAAYCSECLFIPSTTESSGWNAVFNKNDCWKKNNSVVDGKASGNVCTCENVRPGYTDSPERKITQGQVRNWKLRWPQDPWRPGKGWENQIHFQRLCLLFAVQREQHMFCDSRVQLRDERTSSGSQPSWRWTRYPRRQGTATPPTECTVCVESCMCCSRWQSTKSPQGKVVLAAGKVL